MSLLLSVALLAAQAPVNEIAADESPAAEVDASHPEATPFDPTLDANAAVDAALERAYIRGTYVMVVLGANWCHDSRALAGWLESERFAALVGDWYEVVYVDVGMPQTGDGFNLDIAARFGLEDVTNTPTVLILDNAGRLLNRDTAKSRSEDEIYDELALWATTEAARD